ncbi:transporter substrate-binding domain-containing protein [Bulleidia sp. HCP3S3_F2]|uniref:transporter substrate-binding domain-containing protein n=1 Tax=unclassified Bulleidia TaxID=2704656 RepID=UPI002A8820A4|nr:transporter substrate-binding domain-containing protein [Erysipelotrichaceae bacterium]MDD7058140.1 transporter substrate-binding domain-containing protein [Erysipelotrichaceae bacterium]MDY3659697.1 transporter substrate-binding domain-containing protein [Bulleidia sp.]
MKNMNKVLAGLMAAGLLLTTGCASTSTNSSSSTSDWYTGPGYDKLYEELGKADVDLSKADGKLKDILDKGQIVLATSPDYPPSEFVDDQGNVKGSDIMLAQYIANSLGVDLKVETMDFNAVLTAVDTGKVDIGISGFGYKADRAEQFELSHGYQSSSAAAHHTLLVPAEKADEYKSLADFSGKKIDTQANSLQEMYVTDQIPDADLQKVATLDQAILELQTGKIDAIALDSTTAKNYAETSDGMFVSVYEKNGVEFDLSQYADESGNVVAVKKGETSLIDAVNQVIDSLATSGKYESNLYTDMYYAACDAAGVSPNEE